MAKIVGDIGQRVRTAASADIGVNEIIDRTLLRSVFQPLVELSTTQVVGFEGLTRGPAGSPLESPLALLDAARSAGRLADLDWACRTSAVTGALEADLDPALTLFVNLEPETLGTPCPPQLQPAWDQAARRLRIVTEFTERALARDPSALLRAVTASRSNGFAVALDDVGAEPASLALLPFVQPDVVKLDLRLVQDRTTGEIAAIANAVRAYAEESGAVLLAEGIETVEHAQVALVLGATYGQGWLYGRPAALPAGTPAPDRPFPMLRPPDMERIRTPFEIVSAQRLASRSTKSLLLPMSRHLEEQALSGGGSHVILGCFQEAAHFTPFTKERYTELAAATALTAALGVHFPDVPAPGVRGVRFKAADALRNEWDVIVVGPHFAAALVALDCGDSGDDRQRRFDYVITHDRALVLAAARSLMHRLSPTE
jgi:EAL domain-containing protein (putative c-di-GMP-specific phosphodiesterase class I)